jgi:hypothetical protein
MLVRISAGIQIGSLTASMDRGRSQVSLDSRSSSQGSRERHQSRKMKLAAAVILENLSFHLG